MMILMLCVKRSKDPRGAIQNGYLQICTDKDVFFYRADSRFWFWKILIIIGICIGAFFIPNQGFAPSKTIDSSTLIWSLFTFFLN